MGDFLEDVVTAFNQGRLEMANDFKSMIQGNMKFYETHAQTWVNEVAQQYGDDSWRFYGTAVLAGGGEALLEFVQGVGEATFIDPLRLGEGAKKGGFGYVEDGLRVIGVVGGALKLLKLSKIARVAGGPMSCTPTSLAKATGRASFSFVTAEELAKGTGNGVSALSPSYRGAWIEEALPQLRKIVTVESKAVRSASDIETLVAQRRGPVVFSVEWKGMPGIPGGGHTMMAYTDSGALKLADQFGNNHTWKMTTQGLQVIAGPSSTMKVGTVIGTVNRFYSQSGGGVAYLLRDTVLMQTAANAPLGQRVGIPLLRSLDRQFNLKLGFAASLTSFAPTRLKHAGNVVETTPTIYLKTGIENIYGWWWFNMNGGIWCYYFDKNKSVRWYDINNHRSGQGKWSETKTAVEVVWGTGTREQWQFELVPSNQQGTSTSAGKTSKFTAVRVWDSYVAKIVGRWKMNCDKWIWNIDFREDGGVKWSDYYNPAMNGNGTWHLTKNGVYLMWASGSRDEWTFSAGETAASGRTTVDKKPYSFDATKTG